MFYGCIIIHYHLHYTYHYLGAQQEFVGTDKYKRKQVLHNWSKPCIWLNNKSPVDETQDQVTKDWLLANCIFVNLKHRLYLPEPVVPPMFAPRPSLPHTPLFLPSPSAVAQSPPAIAALSLVETPLSYTNLPVCLLCADPGMGCWMNIAYIWKIYCNVKHHIELFISNYKISLLEVV